MDTQSIIGIAVFLSALLILLVFVVYYFQGDSSGSSMRNLMGTGNEDANTMSRVGVQRDVTGSSKHIDEERIRELKEQKLKELKTKSAKGNELESKFFKAGLYSKEERDNFYRSRIILMILVGAFFCIVTTFLLSDIILTIIASTVAAVFGYRLPNWWLDSTIHRRDEDILYYLPLVIEQVAIGVSSSLDIGPALGLVVSMADERDAHNVVTELVRHVNYYVKSGASLQEALTEVGAMSGHTELNHAFMSLAQVAKHGGEISKQLQELADAVSAQRETKVEERVRKLELKATGPVAVVFVGFMIILVAGFFIQIKIGMKM